jgi:hypothetical protein
MTDDLWSNAPEAPPAITPVPASGRTDLRGKRLLVGLPGIGWRGDLRGDSAVIQSSRTYVPALPEHEWYRAESERIEVFAPLIPIERVWIELPAAMPSPPSVVPRSVFERLVSLDGPPKREPVPVRDVPGVTGRRIVHSDGTRLTRDLRAVTEPYQTAEGDVCLHICAELDWYRWGWSGKSPRIREIPIYQLWVE